MHTEDEKGVPLTSEYLSDSYGKLNAKYYGPAVEEDPEIKFEWSRIPHFIIITMFSNTRLAFLLLQHWRRKY